MGTERKIVAVVGAGGLVGRALTPLLAAEYDLRLLDRTPDRTAGIKRLDARRVRALARAVHGCDAVVDLAAEADWHTPWARVYRSNIRLTVAVLEAARISGVRTVVHAGSNQVTAGYERDEPWASVLAGRLEGLDPQTLARIPVTTHPRPVTAYGAGKAFSEAACAWYAAEFGLTTTCLRIGSLLSPDRPRNSRHLSTWLSHRDLAGYVAGALERPPDQSATTVWGVSANRWRIWDTCDSQRLCGYTPVDDAEAWRDEIPASGP